MKITSSSDSVNSKCEAAALSAPVKTGDQSGVHSGVVPSVQPAVSTVVSAGPVNPASKSKPMFILRFKSSLISRNLTTTTAAKRRRVPSIYKSLAIGEAEKAVTDYLHTTRSLSYSHAEHIASYVKRKQFAIVWRHR